MQTYTSRQDFLDIKNAYEQGTTVEGTLEEEFTRGNGYKVTLYNGVKARIFSRHLPNFIVHEGMKLSFKVAEFEETYDELYGTRRNQITVSYFQWRAEGITEGRILSGIIKTIKWNYLIMDYQGINLYLPKDEICERSEIQADDLRTLVGRQMTVLVTDVDMAQANIKVSEKRYFDEATRVFREGRSYEAIVTGIDKDFVSIEVEGGFPAYINKKDLQWGHSDISYETFVGERRDVRFLGASEGLLFFSSKQVAVHEYDDELYYADAAELLSRLGFIHNSFTGRISSDPRKDFQIIENIIADNIEDKGALLADPYSAEPIKVIVPNEYHSMFENGKYYHFSLVEAKTGYRKHEKSPYRFTLNDSSFIQNGIIPVEDPYKRLVDVQATKFSEPSPNRALARTLEEVGQGLYDSKDRMFFELLQNADDASSENGVKVFLEAVDGYLLLSHNGRAFNRKDFSAITSSGSSNKGSDKKKTGYKGIGFKSVFTNSSTVRIKSGGFDFLFDKTRPIYETFEGYYFTMKNLTDPDEQDRFIDDNRDDYEDFKGVESIPWQMIPIWSEGLPASLRKSIFNSRSNVSIALGMDDASKKEYLDAIVDVLNDPKFMLFLRNTTRIRLKDGNQEFNLAKKKDDHGIVTIQSTQTGKEILQRFFVKDGTLVKLSDQAFMDTGVDIVIREKPGTGQSKTEHVFEDSIGKKIPQIPPRISESDSTEISFAVWMEEDDRTFKVQKESNSFYAYLPMVEKRFPFPIYINADFVLKSNRQGIKSDNPWNHFLMYHIGLSYPKWIGGLADARQPQYLNLLPSKLFNEGDKDQADLARMFNKGFLSSLATEKFILNDRGDLVGQSEIVVDHTGLSKVIGGDNFCFLLDIKDRRLPCESIDCSILDESIFSDVSRIDSVREVLLNPTNLKYIRFWFSHASKEKKMAAFEWVRKQNDSLLTAHLPLLSFSGRCRSINEASGQQFLYITADLLPAYEILNKLGFSCLNYKIETHPLYESSLKDFLKESIVSQVLTLISTSETKAESLEPTEKASLYNVISGLCTRKEQKEALAAWMLFSNSEGKAMPLAQLMPKPQDESEAFLLSKHIVSETELDAMDDSIKGKMMPTSKVYHTVFIDGWDDVAKRWLDKAKELEMEPSKLISLYKVTSKYFNASEEFVADPDAAPTLSGKDFIIFRNDSQEAGEDKIIAFYNCALENKDVYDVVCKACSNTVPIFESLEFLKNKPFVKEPSLMSSLNFKEDIQLCASEVISIIEAFIAEKESFFQHFKVVSNDNGFNIVKRGQKDWLYFCESLALKNFIKESCQNAFNVPASFRKYADGEFVLKNSELFTKLFEEISVQDHYKDLLPIVIDESAEVKRQFLDKLSNITLKKEQLTKDADEVKLLRLGCSLYKPDEKDKSLYPSSSNLFIAYSDESCTDKTMPLNEIPMQGKVSVGEHSFSLDDLQPGTLKSFQQEAKNVLETLASMEITEKYLNSLFNIDATVDPDELFVSLNAPSALLNGKQLAFMLRYKEVAGKANHPCTLSFQLTNAAGRSVPFNRHWLICQHSFIKPECKLDKKYWDVLDCLTDTEYRNEKSSIWFETSAGSLDSIKDTLNEEEGKELLDYMFGEWNTKGTSWDNNILSRIASRLSLDTVNTVCSSNYALASESLTGIVKSWEPSCAGKIQFLSETFGIKDDSSDIVNARRYISTSIDKPEVKLNQTDQQKLCSWISEKKLILDDDGYAFFKDVVAQKYYSDEIDVDALKKAIASPQKTIRAFKVYKYDGAMPHKVLITSPVSYCFFKYAEGSWFVSGTSIYVNSKEWNDLCTILVAILSDKGNSFDKDDLLAFYQSENSGFQQRSREIDDEMEDLRNKLNAYKQYFEEQNLDITSIDRKMAGLSKDQMWEALKEARQQVRVHLRNIGYSVPFEEERRTDWTCIKGVTDNDGNPVTIIVRSFIDNVSRHFVLDADEWIHLTQDEKAELWIRTGQGKIRCFDFRSLVRNKHKLAFEFSTANMDYKGKMDALAQILRWFNGLNFDFGSVLPEGSTTAEAFLKKDVKLEEVLTADDKSFFPGMN